MNSASQIKNKKENSLNYVIKYSREISSYVLFESVHCNQLSERSSI